MLLTHDDFDKNLSGTITMKWCVGGAFACNEMVSFFSHVGAKNHPDSRGRRKISPREVHELCKQCFIIMLIKRKTFGRM